MRLYTHTLAFMHASTRAPACVCLSVTPRLIADRRWGLGSGRVQV